MNKLQTIKHSLARNRHVILMDTDRGSLEIDRRPEGIDATGFQSGYSVNINFVVVPKEPLYTAYELQNFMVNLIPCLKLTQVNREDFRYYGRDAIRFGYLYFDDEIGQEKVRRTCTLTDKELVVAPGFKDRQRIIEETWKYVRRTYVRVFPCEAFVKECNKKGYSLPPSSISLKKFEKYNTGGLFKKTIDFC